MCVLACPPYSSGPEKPTALPPPQVPLINSLTGVGAGRAGPSSPFPGVLQSLLPATLRSLGAWKAELSLAHFPSSLALRFLCPRLSHPGSSGHPVTDHFPTKEGEAEITCAHQSMSVCHQAWHPFCLDTLPPLSASVSLSVR